MTLPGQRPPSQEKYPYEQFTGIIQEVPYKRGHNTLVSPMLKAELGSGNRIVISPDAEAPYLGDFFGAPIVARLELGGYEDDEKRIPPVSAFVARVDFDKMTNEMRDLIKIELMENTPGVDDMYLFGIGERRLEKFTVVRPNTGFALFGRNKNNMDWYNYLGTPIDIDTKDEVIPNTSLSRMQLLLGYGEDGLSITGHSANSRTLVTTVATDQHRRIAELNRIAVEEKAPVELKRAPRKGLLKFLGKSTRT